jgi:hypothetical protein
VFETELRFFITHQDELVRQFQGKVLILKDEEVAGAYDSPLGAFLAAEQRFEPGTYMLQPCEPGPGAYTVMLSERVVDAPKSP